MEPDEAGAGQQEERPSDRSMVDEYNDVDFLNLFRLTKRSFRALFININADIARTKLSSERNLLGVLLFLGGARSQKEVAERIGVKPIIFQKEMMSVCDVMIQYLQDFVRMPCSPQECFVRAKAFEMDTGFPRCIGAIGCLDVKMKNSRNKFVSTCKFCDI